MTGIGGPPKVLVSRRDRIILVAGLIFLAVSVMLSLRYSRATPDLAAIRAVEEASGPGAEAIRVIGRYQFEDIDGSAPWNIQLVCGSVIQHGEKKLFAALINHRGRSTTFDAVELVIEPPTGRPRLPREAQLLGACRG